MSLIETILERTNWLTIVLAAIVCLAIYVYVQWTQMPPGPFGLPYVGYYPFLSKDCHVELQQMTKKYGKVFCFKVTGQLYANVGDIKAIREIATKSDCFETRPANFSLFQNVFEGGVFYLKGEEWKVLRKFFILKFKEFGMGKKTQEGVIQDSLKKTVNALNESDGNEFPALNFFCEIADSVVRQMVFGDVKLDENEVQNFVKSYTFTTEFSTYGANILLAGPFLKYILIPFVPEYRKFRKHKIQMDTILSKIVQQHERDFDRNNIRNLLDAYINERKLLEEKKDPKAKFFTEGVLVGSVLQFFGDGILGVGWLAAAILDMLSSYPDVQKAIQSEIDEVAGRNRFLSLDDKSSLSYTTAAIYEALRMYTIFPILPLLECTKETTLGGCRIPKGTVAAHNIWALCHDPELYDEPDKFDPTRFLPIDGKKSRCEIPAVFGVGRRTCTGEPMVNMQLLLYVATVLQHFDLHPVKKRKTQPVESDIFIRATPRAL